MPLSSEQQKQVAEQLKKHQRSAGVRTIVLDEENSITLKVQIDKDVFGSDIMSSGIYLARFLYRNQHLYKDKAVLDMGCGPGTQGIIMGLYGAESVTFSDISSKAVQNTKKNAAIFKIKNAEVYESDLFTNFPAKKQYDLIVFNHPFFPEKPNSELKQSMLGSTDTLKRFLQIAPGHMSASAKIIMPYFHFAGTENDPKAQLANFGLKLAEEREIISSVGLQQGKFSIYTIEKN